LDRRSSRGESHARDVLTSFSGIPLRRDIALARWNTTQKILFDSKINVVFPWNCPVSAEDQLGMEKLTKQVTKIAFALDDVMKLRVNSESLGICFS
jgi:hypothetical protein